jgi:hypothetical protein
MCYRVYEEMVGGFNTVLLIDSIEEARQRYSKCYGSQRGAGGIWDNDTPKGGYGWVY